MIKAIFKSPFLGAFFVGFGLSITDASVFSTPLIDAIIFIPMGIILLTVSYHLTTKKL